jgi:class 3 adenylate cyclase
MSNNNVDTLIARYLKAEDDLAILGKHIEQSGQSIAVVFVDVVGSTQLKHEVSTARWLGYVLRFLEAIAQLAVKHQGNVVKRIGDEVMLTFPTAIAADSFVEATGADASLVHYRYKIAADWGLAFHVSFAETTALDPYGMAVDRAARIAKFASSGTVLASDAFVKALPDSNRYASLGAFPMKGLPEAQELYLRQPDPAAAGPFVEDIVKTLNEQNLKPHFRYVPRPFTAADFEWKRRRRAHPFLVRELLNLPLLPHTIEAFLKLCETQREQMAEFIGHIVEWDAYFHSATYERSLDYFFGSIGAGPDDASVLVAFTTEMADTLSQIKANDRVRVRAVLVAVGPVLPWLDYADIQMAG